MKKNLVSRQLALFLCSLAVLSSKPVYTQQTGVENFQYISPVPGSAMNQPETNIIIRYGLPYQKNNLSSETILKVIGQESGLHSGELIFAEENRTLVFNPDFPFNEGELVTVQLNNSLRDENNNFLPSLSFNFNITKKNLNKNILADPNSFISSIIKSEFPVQQGKKCYSKTDKSVNDLLPNDFPSIVLNTNNNPTPGEIFFTPFIYPGFAGTYLIISDNYGVPVFYRKATAINYDFKKQPTGVLSYFQNNSFHLIDSSYNFIDSLYMENGYVTDLHEFLLLQNGHSLMMSYDLQHIGMDTVVTGGDPNARVVGLVVQELDENKDVVFQWRSWDHFQITDATYDIDLTDSIIDYVHGNAIDVDSDGNLLISSRHLDEVTKINRQTGDIIWRLGGEYCKNNQFTFINDPVGFSHQHDIRRLANGNITVFDNGNLHDPMFSRSAEYQIDETNRFVQLIADYRNDPISTSWAMGSSRRLENHNTIIGWGTDLERAITEVTIDGTVTLSLTIPDSMLNYRAFKFPWKTNLFTINYDSLYFGYVPPGDSLELSVEVTNNSNQQIEINSTYNRLSCYYVKTLVPIILSPYGSQEIRVMFKPVGDRDFIDDLHLRWETGGQRIAQVVQLFGTADPNSAVGDSDPKPDEFNLSQNYPNPFNPSTTIRYYIPERSFVTIKIYDVLGKEVATIVNEEKYAGIYEIEFAASNLSSGIYFYSLSAGNYLSTKKMILLK